MNGRTVSRLPIKPWGLEERVRDIERRLDEHVRSGLHYVGIGYYEEVKGADTVKSTVWQNSRRAAKKYEKLETYDPSIPANLLSVEEWLYDDMGKQIKHFITRNFVYSGLTITKYETIEVK